MCLHCLTSAPHAAASYSVGLIKISTATTVGSSGFPTCGHTSFSERWPGGESVCRERLETLFSGAKGASFPLFGIPHSGEATVLAQCWPLPHSSFSPWIPCDVSRHHLRLRKLRPGHPASCPRASSPVVAELPDGVFVPPCCLSLFCILVLLLVQGGLGRALQKKMVSVRT